MLFRDICVFSCSCGILYGRLVCLQEEKNRRRILQLNRKEAEKRTNQELLAKSKKNKESEDSEWLPNMEDDDSQDSVIKDVVAHGAQVSGI